MHITYTILNGNNHENKMIKIVISKKDIRFWKLNDIINQQYLTIRRTRSQLNTLDIQRLVIPRSHQGEYQ